MKKKNKGLDWIDEPQFTHLVEFYGVKALYDPKSCKIKGSNWWNGWRVSFLVWIADNLLPGPYRIKVLKEL